MIDSIALVGLVPVFLAAMISPGPDFFIVSQTALSRGFAAGAWTAAGIASGVAFYAALAVLGLAYVLSQAAWLTMVIKIAGGLYLLWLAWKMLQSSSTTASSEQLSVRHRNPYLTGLLSNLTNPKVVVFFGSLFAAALTPQASLATKLAMIGMSAVLPLLWFCFVAACLALPAVRERYQSMRDAINRIGGVIIGLFGIKLLWSARSQ
ncbi:threonine export protein RhtC [Steroidobacter agaridevorans]|uniref:Threonine export protein RhtC n=1 Tax=Steroidobacter agaridevorans TaxID=2695856 RepID=A0A829YNX3_9GAMM|nr:LysE family transporter [Steroidobacter agaridevorans]GFE84186.1 threonine export protein RhtC [Steroidobacter agaridevorans]GFE87009.1 threonine export protein RhtC [Steroidobacter agaridevorans]